MKLSCFLPALLLLCFHSAAQNKLKPVYLNGTVQYFHNEMTVEDMSELNELSLPGRNRAFIPDSNGRFNIRFNIAAPNYFRIGRNILYLSPGDHLTVNINYNQAASSTFTGTHSAENEYLRNTPFPKAGSFLNGGSNLKATIAETVDAVLKAGEARTKELESYKNISPEFKWLELARIKADILNSINMIYVYMAMKQKLQVDSLDAFAKVCNSVTAPVIGTYAKGFVNKAYLKLKVYRDVIDLIAANNKTGVELIKDWAVAENIANHVKYLNDKENIALYRDSLSKITSTLYRNTVKRTVEELMRFGKGDAAKDFAFATPSEEAVQLSEYRGKVIYIDLWATWCGPCIEEMPALEKLKSAYDGNAGIVFLSLSIDDDHALWKRFLSNRNSTGIQGIIDRNKLNDYKITGVPRIIIINKDFKISEMSGPLPSSKSTKALLDELLK